MGKIATHVKTSTDAPVMMLVLLVEDMMPVLIANTANHGLDGMKIESVKCRHYTLIKG